MNFLDLHQCRLLLNFSLEFHIRDLPDSSDSDVGTGDSDLDNLDSVSDDPVSVSVEKIWSESEQVDRVEFRLNEVAEESTFWSIFWNYFQVFFLLCEWMSNKNLKIRKQRIIKDPFCWERFLFSEGENKIFWWKAEKSFLNINIPFNLVPH